MRWLSLMPDVLTIFSIMPKKVKRKSSFGRPSASDGAKRKAKYSQEKDDFNENAAKGMRIIRYVMVWNPFLYSEQTFLKS